MSKQKEALGKGIRALLDGIDDQVNTRDSGKGKASGYAEAGTVIFLPLKQIEVNPFQPRASFDEESLKELSESIRVHGVIQPITVRQLDKNKYQLIAGERRLRASKLAGKEDIPAFVRTANDQESLEIALIENIQREDLNAIEIGLNYKRLLDECELSHEELGTRLGKNRTTVTNYLRLLKLPPDVQAGIRNKDISMGHARALIAVDNVDTQLSIYKDIVKKKLSVRQVEEMVRNLDKSNKKKSNSAKGLPTELRRIQDNMSSHLGTRVMLKPKSGGKGEIVISYFSDEDLERIRELLTEND